MSAIVLVHGIGQERYNADWLESLWLPPLAGALRLAGDVGTADRVWRDAPTAGGVDARMAFYGDIFLRKGSMGAQVDEPHSEFAEALALEWLTRAKDRATSPADRHAAAAQLAEGSSPHGPRQGAPRRALGRSAASLARLSWFARGGYRALSVIKRSLAQVDQYFRDEQVRESAQHRVAELVSPDTKVIVAHSLGTVVAYEAIHKHQLAAPRLITLGSPLGLHTVIYERIIPQPPLFPSGCRRWLNVNDPDDLVAAERDLTQMFGAIPAGAELLGLSTVENGSRPHDARFYLAQSIVANEILSSLQ